MNDAIHLRPPTAAGLDRCAAICFDAFGGINADHGFPSDFPSPDVAAGLMGLVFNSTVVTGVVAEVRGRVVVSALILIECSSLRVAALLALTVWCFARAYYFAFYVVQHYADPGYRFAGLGSFAAYLIRRRRRGSRASQPPG